MREAAKRIFSSLALLVMLGILLLPVGSARAQFRPYWGGGDDPILSCTGNYNAPAGVNKCTSLCDAIKTFNNIVRFGYTVLVFIIAPVFFIYGGFLLMFSNGDPARIRSGWNVMKGAAIGSALVLGSFLIVTSLLWLAGNTTADPQYRVSWPQIACDPTKVPGGQIDLQAYERISQMQGGSNACAGYTCPSGQQCVSVYGQPVCENPGSNSAPAAATTQCSCSGSQVCTMDQSTGIPGCRSATSTTANCPELCGTNMVCAWRNQTPQGWHCMMDLSPAVINQACPDSCSSGGKTCTLYDSSMGCRVTTSSRPAGCSSCRADQVCAWQYLANTWDCATLVR